MIRVSWNRSKCGTVNVICRENGFPENYLKYELITENLW